MCCVHDEQNHSIGAPFPNNVVSGAHAHGGHAVVMESGQAAGPGAGAPYTTSMPLDSSICPDSIVDDGAPAAAGARCGAAVVAGDARCEAGNAPGAAAAG